MTAAPAPGWIAYLRPRPEARLRLVCFPYAGGGASVYRGWQEALPGFIEVWPVQPPGREGRIREAPLTSVDALVDGFLDAHARDLEAAPYALFGHSMGATLAHETALRLVRRGGPPPLHLAVSARRAPHRPEHHPPIHDLPEDEFRAELRRLNGTPQEVLDHPELMDLIGPMLRADFTLIETYRPGDTPPLDAPITAYGGLADPDVPRDDLEAWSECTRRRFRVGIFPGDHFFFNGISGTDLRADLARELASAVAAG
jgi:surfactin synthase thioesterase subunit